MDANNYIEEFSNDLNPSYIGLDYYSKRIETIENALKELENTTSISLDEKREKIKNYEIEIKNLKAKKQVARDTLDKIRGKSKSFIEESKLAIGPEFDSELTTFLKEYSKEYGVYTHDHLKADKKIYKTKKVLEKELEKNGSKVLIASTPLESLSLKDYKKLQSEKAEGLDVIADNIIKKQKDTPQKEHNLESFEVNQSKKIEVLINNANLTSKEKDDLFVIKSKYDIIEKCNNKIIQINKFVDKLHSNPNYEKTVLALGNIKILELKNMDKLKKEIDKLDSMNIDNLYEEYKKLEDINKKIEVDNKDLDRMKASDNKFAQDRVPSEEEKLDSLYNERNNIINNDEHLEYPKEKVVEEDPIVMLNNIIEEKQKDEGLRISSSSSYQKYAVEKVKGTDLGSGTFSEYLESTMPENVDLINFQKQKEERDYLIYEKYQDYLASIENNKPSMNFEQYAKKMYNIEGVQEPVMDNNKNIKK